MNVHKGRKSITQRPFRILADCERIYLFLIEIYERDWRNGVPAPFFEYAYALFSYWMDISYSSKNSIRECNGEIVAFCFYENPDFSAVSFSFAVFCISAEKLPLPAAFLLLLVQGYGFIPAPLTLPILIPVSFLVPSAVKKPENVLLLSPCRPILRILQVLIPQVQWNPQCSSC